MLSDIIDYFRSSVYSNPAAATGRHQDNAKTAVDEVAEVKDDSDVTLSQLDMSAHCRHENPGWCSAIHYDEVGSSRLSLCCAHWVSLGPQSVTSAYNAFISQVLKQGNVWLRSDEAAGSFQGDVKLTATLCAGSGPVNDSEPACVKAIALRQLVSADHVSSLALDAVVDAVSTRPVGAVLPLQTVVFLFCRTLQFACFL
jgi:hypothetical protein